MIELEDIPAGGQRTNIVRSVCAAIADIRPVDRPEDIASFAAANC